MNYKNKITIITYNANGIKKQKKIFEDFIEKHQPEIILIQETNLKPNTRFSIKNYNTIRNDRTTAQRGGTATLIKQNIKFTHTDTNKEDETEITIFTKNRKKLTIINKYISPNINFKREDFKELMRNRKNTMIIGDLNAKDRTWGCNSNNTRGKYLKEVIEKRANTQIIATTNATRIDPNGRDDILDIAIAIDMKSNIRMRTLKQLESDHLPVKITIKTNIDNTIISKMNKKEINWKNMRTELNKHEVIEYTNNTQIIEQNTEKIIKQIQNAVKASEKTTTITNKHKKLPIEIYYLIKEKRKLQRQFRETRHTQIKTKYNKINQEIKKKITEHSKEQWNKYIEKRLDEKDSHNFYIIPRQLKAKRNTIPTLEEGNNKAETDQEKAEMLAKKYEEIFTPNKLHIDITKEIDKFEKNFNNWCCVPNLNIIKPSDIKQDIKQLKKASAPGEYQITNTILKNLPHKTIVSITNIFNSTIAQNYYPQCLKTAIIVPIQKPGKNKKMTTSYRPINLLPTIGKLLDRRIQEEILNQIEIDDRQYGFRQGHSTTQQLFNITNTIASAFNKKETTAAIFLDLSNAFDKIDHRSLIHKLSNFQN